MQSEEQAIHDFSSEEDNFLTLECDEHLYEDDRFIRNFENYKQQPVIQNKSSYLETQIKKHTSREASKASVEAVDDTIPDFGFVRNEETVIKEFK